VEKLEYVIHVDTPRSLTQAQIAEIYNLVAQGGQVNLQTLHTRLLEAELIGFIKSEGRIVATASLKRPRDTAGDNAFVKSGSPLSYADFPLELGYAIIAPEYRGLHLAGPLCQTLCDQCPSRNLFATTRKDNLVAQKILLNHRFFLSGNPFRDRNDLYDLSLFVKLGVTP
jgi:hypothetical protein